MNGFAHRGWSRKCTEPWISVDDLGLIHADPCWSIDQEMITTKGNDNLLFLALENCPILGSTEFEFFHIDSHKGEFSRHCCLPSRSPVCFASIWTATPNRGVSKMVCTFQTAKTWEGKWMNIDINHRILGYPMVPYFQSNPNGIMSDLTFGELSKVVNSNTMVNSLPPMKGRSGQSPLISGMGYMKSWLAWHSVQSLWYTNEHPTNYVGIFLSKKFDRFRIVGEHGDFNDYPKLARLKKEKQLIGLVDKNTLVTNSDWMEY